MNYQTNYFFNHPVRLLYGTLRANDVTCMLPFIMPSDTLWGEKVEIEGFEITQGNECELEISWISLKTRKTFYYRTLIQIPENIVALDFVTMIIGLSCNGEVVVWLNYDKQAIVIHYNKGIDITSDFTDSMVTEAGLKDRNGRLIDSVEKLCADSLDKFKELPGFDLSLIPEGDYYERIMRQYNYQFVLEGLTHDIAQNAVIDVACFDGTFNKLEDGSLLQYHSSGVPCKISVQFNVRNTEYSACFWLDDEEITRIFERFYGAHRETKTDFIVRIDAENRIYGLALFRQGLREPVEIPASAYELIVFKNRFEDYRSDNYSQPRGAWIW